MFGLLSPGLVATLAPSSDFVLAILYASAKFENRSKPLNLTRYHLTITLRLV